MNQPALPPTADAQAEPANRGLLAGLIIACLVLIVLILAVLLWRRLSGDRVFVRRQIEQHVARLRDGPTDADRRAAAGAIADLGSEALHPALDAVANLSADGATLEIGKPGLDALAQADGLVAALGEALQHPVPDVRAGAVQVLARMGAASAAVVGPLTAALNDPHGWIRGCACDCLGNAGAAGAPAVPTLVSLASQRSEYARRRALVALGRIGPAASAAAPMLAKIAAEDSSPVYREAAAMALYEIDLPGVAARAEAEAPTAVRQLLAKAGGADAFEAVDAIKRLGAMGEDAAAAVPALTLALGRPDKWVREAAATALGGMGKSARPALPVLRRAAEDAEAEVAAAARRATEAIGR